MNGQRWNRNVNGQRWRSANTLCGGGSESHEHQQLHCTVASRDLCCITNDLNFTIMYQNNVQVLIGYVIFHCL